MTIKSNFEIDPRIKDVKDIQTSWQYDDSYIGCKGYFFDYPSSIKDLNSMGHYGTLLEIEPYDMYDERDGDKPFKGEAELYSLNGKVVDVIRCRYFIPECLLQTKEDTLDYDKELKEELFNLVDVLLPELHKE